MRGRNTLTAGYRVFLFVLIVKRDIEIFVWFVAENDDIHLVRRGELCSPVCSGFAQKALKCVILSVAELLDKGAVI